MHILIFRLNVSVQTRQTLCVFLYCQLQLPRLFPLTTAQQRNVSTFWSLIIFLLPNTLHHFTSLGDEDIIPCNTGTIVNMEPMFLWVECRQNLLARKPWVIYWTEMSGFPLHLLVSRIIFRFSPASVADSDPSEAQQSFTHSTMSHWVETNADWDRAIIWTESWWSVLNDLWYISWF